MKDPRNTWVSTRTSLPLPRGARLFASFLHGILTMFRIFAYPGICNICGRPTIFAITDANLRENIICMLCRSFNRSRQMYYVFAEQPKSRAVTIWNMENSGSLHTTLSRRYGEHYVSSGYFGTGIPPGQEVRGIRHEDVRRTSFPSSFFDFILSSDVLEHVSNPEAAFREVYRILRPGGKFIFTVPFLENSEHSDRRAEEKEAGEIAFLQEPQYHGDPVRPEGILVFTIFGWDVLEMAGNAGLRCSVRKLSSVRHGIAGNGAVVFMAAKADSTSAEPGR